jgi:hypothetical protein
MPSMDPEPPRSTDEDDYFRDLAIKMLLTGNVSTLPSRDYQGARLRLLLAQHATNERISEARGMARAIVIVLEKRGVPMPDDFRDRVLECSEPHQLDTWLRRASTATTIDKVIWP